MKNLYPLMSTFNVLNYIFIFGTYIYHKASSYLLYLPVSKTSCLPVPITTSISDELFNRINSDDFERS